MTHPDEGGNPHPYLHRAHVGERRLDTTFVQRHIYLNSGHA